MKRTTSTAKTRGMITRIISTTNALVKVYNTETDEIEEFEIEMSGVIPERKAVTAIFSGGYIDKDKYKILSVKDITTTGILYGMTTDEFIKHARIIETGITNE